MKKKLRLREIVSSILILVAVLLIGCQLRVGWIVGVIGGCTRLTVMVQDRRWYYVALDVSFLVLDVVMFGAWSGWWANYPRLWIIGTGLTSWLNF